MILQIEGLSGPRVLFSSGLWAVCLDGFHDMRHQYEVRLYGCKHILLEEYDYILAELRPRKTIINDYNLRIGPRYKDV